jgi:hypothetical protein
MAVSERESPTGAWLRALRARGVTFSCDSAGRLHVTGRLSAADRRRLYDERIAIAKLLHAAERVESGATLRRVVGQQVRCGAGPAQTSPLYADDVAAIPMDAAFHHRDD